MKKVFNVILVLTFLLSTKIFAAHLNFTASLTGLQEVPAVSTSASGTGAFTLTTAGGLNFIITVNGLSGPITAAHFHFGSLKQNGPIVKDISSFTGNTASGSWKSTDAQPLNDSLIAALMTGKIYVNIHTSANPGGEIRGLVLVSSGTTLIARLDGRNEVPSITTNARGIGSVTLASVGGVGLVYNLSVNGLSGPVTGAHFHVGEIGVSGPIVFDITNSFNGSNAAGVWRTTGANALPDSVVRALLTGRLYLNVHTAANPSGEIRGQLYLNAGFGMEANLDGPSNVPPVITNAKATASLTLTDYGLIFDLTMQGLSGPLNNAHFHRGDSGVNGPIVFDILNLFSNNTVRGIWRSSSAGGNLTPALLKDLLDGRIYINLHTALNPGGEIRSQIKLKNGSGITAKMTGLQEVPSVITSASGTASMLANPTSVIYKITVNGLSGPITVLTFILDPLKKMAQ